MPNCLTLNMNWEDSPSGEAILKLLLSLQNNIKLEDFYEIDNTEENNTEYALRGLIIYSHYHYYSYIKQRSWSVGEHSGTDRWLEFND